MSPSKSHPLLTSGILAATFLLSATLPAAINIDGYGTLTNDRFSNDSSFIADAFDLSGVGIADTSQSNFGSDDGGRWLTMVSENVYITAEHFHANPGSSVTFYASNDPNGTTATRTLSNDTQQIGGTDLFLGTLDSPLGSNFNFYDFATEDINDANGGPGSFKQSTYEGENAYLFGRSPDTNFPVDQDMAVGRNKLDHWFGEFNAAGNTGDAIGSIDHSSGETDHVNYEAFLQIGDSGAPMFVDDGSGGLTIVGINWFTATIGGDPINGQTYVGNYDQDIQAFIDANPVPEPAAFAAVLGGAVLLLANVRRFRQKSPPAV